jgi:hypothetical protein
MTTINHRGVNMKRLIALLTIVALGITILSPPIAAICPDPSRPVPWMDNRVNSEGDESGWHEADSEGGDGIVVIFDLFKVYGSKYFIIYFVPNKIDNNGAIGRDDVSNNADIPTDRSASSR